MKYVLLLDAGLRYPYTDVDLRRDNPGTSFPVQMTDALRAEWGVYPVQPTTPPPHDPINEDLSELDPVLVDGAWVQQWQVLPASPEEIAARQQQVKQQITARVQQRLDEFAQTRGYDNIVSACSYATSQHPKYGPEGRYCVQAREDTWDVLFSIEEQVIAGTRPLPTSYEDVEPELPVLVWPV